MDKGLIKCSNLMEFMLIESLRDSHYPLHQLFMEDLLWYYVLGVPFSLSCSQIFDQSLSPTIFKGLTFLYHMKFLYFSYYYLHGYDVLVNY